LHAKNGEEELPGIAGDVLGGELVDGRERGEGDGGGAGEGRRGGGGGGWNVWLVLLELLLLKLGLETSILLEECLVGWWWILLYRGREGEGREGRLGRLGREGGREGGLGH